MTKDEYLKHKSQLFKRFEETNRRLQSEEHTQLLIAYARETDYVALYRGITDGKYQLINGDVLADFYFLEELSLEQWKKEENELFTLIEKLLPTERKAYLFYELDEEIQREIVLDDDDVDESDEEQIEKLIDYNCLSEIDRRVFDKDGCFLDDDY